MGLRAEIKELSGLSEDSRLGPGGEQLLSKELTGYTTALRDYSKEPSDSYMLRSRLATAHLKRGLSTLGGVDQNLLHDIDRATNASRELHAIRSALEVEPEGDYTSGLILNNVDWDPCYSNTPLDSAATEADRDDYIGALYHPLEGQSFEDYMVK
jgi:hypothetical protein